MRIKLLSQNRPTLAAIRTIAAALAFIAVVFFGCVSTPTTGPLNESPNPARSQSPDAPGDSENGAIPPAASIANNPSANDAFATGDYLASDILNVRNGPSMKNTIIRTIPKSQKVTSLGVENRIWVKISPNEFVSSNFLKKLP